MSREIADESHGSGELCSTRCICPWRIVWSKERGATGGSTGGLVGISFDASKRICTITIADGASQYVVERAYASLVSAHLAYADSLFPIHGSCVRRQPLALCVAGAAGVGKSTLAAALVARGAKFVSDGVTIVDPETALVQPGPAMRRLWDDAIRWLGDDPEKYPTLKQGPPKRLCPVPECDLVKEPPRLGKILIVEDADDLSIARLRPQESVIELIRHGFLSPWLDENEAPKLTQLSAAVARRVPVFRLLRPKSFDAIDGTLALIESELV